MPYSSTGTFTLTLAIYWTKKFRHYVRGDETIKQNRPMSNLPKLLAFHLSSEEDIRLKPGQVAARSSSSTFITGFPTSGY